MWKSFLRGYGALTGKKPRTAVTGHVRYVYRAVECVLGESISYGEVVEEQRQILARWRDIYQQETGRTPLEGTENYSPGQRKAGPKGRWDARVMERLAIPLPNDIFEGVEDPTEMRRRVRQLVFRLELNSTDIIWALHRGHRPGKADNLHVHVVFRPRGIDGKKLHWTRNDLKLWRQRQHRAVTDWVIQQGIDAQVSGPSAGIHLGPRKAALSTRGITLHNRDDQRMALALDLAHASRQMTTKAAKQSWEAAEAEGGEGNLREDGWKLEQVGSRGTWTLIFEAVPRIHFAIRRLAGVQEREVAARIQVMRARTAEAARPAEKEVLGRQIELARHPRTGEVAVWDADTGTILVFDDQGNLVRRVHILRVSEGEIDWTAVGRMAIGRRHLGDGDTCGAVVLGHDPVRLDSYLARIQADECRTRQAGAISED